MLRSLVWVEHSSKQKTGGKQADLLARVQSNAVLKQQAAQAFDVQRISQCMQARPRCPCAIELFLRTKFQPIRSMVLVINFMTDNLRAQIRRHASTLQFLNE